GDRDCSRPGVYHANEIVICVGDINVSRSDKYALRKIKLSAGRRSAIAGVACTKGEVACYRLDIPVRGRNLTNHRIVRIRDKDISQTIHNNSERIVKLGAGRRSTIARITSTKGEVACYRLNVAGACDDFTDHRIVRVGDEDVSRPVDRQTLRREHSESRTGGGPTVAGVTVSTVARDHGKRAGRIHFEDVA